MEHRKIKERVLRGVERGETGKDRRKWERDRRKEEWSKMGCKGAELVYLFSL